MTAIVRKLEMVDKAPCRSRSRFQARCGSAVAAETKTAPSQRVQYWKKKGGELLDCGQRATGPCSCSDRHARDLADRLFLGQVEPAVALAHLERGEGPHRRSVLRCGARRISGSAWRVMTSLQRVAIGFSLAAIVGVLLGAFIGQSVWAMRGLDPIFQVLRTVPPLAWLPISLAAFRDANPSAIFVIFITSPSGR